MFRSIQKTLPVGGVFAAIVVVAAVALAAAACGDDGGDNGDVEARLETIQQDIDSLQASITRTEVFGAMQAMRAQEIHQLNLDVQALSSLEDATDHETRLRRTSEAVRVTHWPEDLLAPAEDLRGALQDAIQAFSDEDLGATKTAVRDAHDLWHVLDSAAAGFLGTEADHNGHAGGDESDGDQMDGMSDNQSGGHTEDDSDTEHE